MKCRTGLCFSLFIALAPPAFAQGIMTPPDPATMRVRLGPLYLNPSVALTNAGVDTNVFNAADSDAPQRDFTVTVTPATELWLRMGRTWINGSLRENIFWYKKFASERSVGRTYRVGWLVPLTRVSFNVGAGWLHTSERPGFEIDARSQRAERDFTGAAEVRALSKTLFGVRAVRRNVEFDKDAVFLGANLRDELTRTTTLGAITVRHELTPLTTMTLELGREQERFDFSPLRDSISQRVDVALNFDPFALITGSARVGFRNFDPLAADLEGYTGTTVAVDLAYVALGTTRIATQIGRDVQHSFDIAQPYYLQTGFTVSVQQQIYGPVDAQGRAGTQRLSYRTREGAEVAVSDRVDRIRTYGAGVGYRLSSDFRIGFTVDQTKRTSEIDRRQYDGLRYGIAVTYGG